MLDEQGWLDDVPTVPWQDGGAISTPRFTIYELDSVHHLHTVHPSLQFISHIPHSISGEQLVNQFLRCIPDNTWLFKYGRVPLNLIMGEWVWQVSSSGIPSYVHPSLRVPLFCRSLVLRFCFFLSFRSALCFSISTSWVGGATHSVRFEWDMVCEHPFAHMSSEGYTNSATFWTRTIRWFC